MRLVVRYVLQDLHVGGAVRHGELGRIGLAHPREGLDVAELGDAAAEGAADHPDALVARVVGDDRLRLHEAVLSAAASLRLRVFSVLKGVAALTPVPRGWTPMTRDFTCTEPSIGSGASISR